MGHVKMMAATQPFLSGAISKTVNLPHDCTLDDIAEAYLESWRQGLKAVAVYRDGSKGAQPLNVSDGKGAKDIKSAKDATPMKSRHAAADRVLARCRRARPAPRPTSRPSKPRSPRSLRSRRSSVLRAASAFTRRARNVVNSSAGHTTRSDSPSAQDQDA